MPSSPLTWFNEKYTNNSYCCCRLSLLVSFNRFLIVSVSSLMGLLAKIWTLDVLIKLCTIRPLSSKRLCVIFVQRIPPEKDFVQIVTIELSTLKYQWLNLLGNQQFATNVERSFSCYFSGSRRNIWSYFSPVAFAWTSLVSNIRSLLHLAAWTYFWGELVQVN